MHARITSSALEQRHTTLTLNPVHWTCSDSCMLGPPLICTYQLQAHLQQARQSGNPNYQTRGAIAEIIIMTLTLLTKTFGSRTKLLKGLTKSTSSILSTSSDKMRVLPDEYHQLKWKHRGCWCLGGGTEAIRHEATYLSLLALLGRSSSRSLLNLHCAKSGKWSTVIVAKKKFKLMAAAEQLAKCSFAALFHSCS